MNILLRPEIYQNYRRLHHHHHHHQHRQQGERLGFSQDNMLIVQSFLTTSPFSSHLKNDRNLKSINKCTYSFYLLTILISFIVIVERCECDASSRLQTRRLLVKRQAGSQTNSGQSSSSSSGNDKASASSDNANNQDPQEKPPEEMLANLKCSFGSAESPDLCKFQLIENPLSKDLPGWSHGNGKLALYQGGPLQDASSGNDTSGGYIFYETSSLYASSQLNHSLANQNQFEMGPGRQAANKQPSVHTLAPDWQYNSNNNNNNKREYEREYRRVSSSHYSIVSGGNSNNNQQQLQQQQPSPPNGQRSVSSGHGPSDINGPVFVSPNLTATSVAGMCLSFHYAIKGLSADELRVSVNDLKTGKSRPIWSASESSAGNWTRAEVLYSATNKHALQFAAIHQLHSSGSNGQHSNELQAQHQKFRGYIAVDELEIDRHEPTGSDAAGCRGHCNFDGDLCGWTNAESGPEGDDFDWSFGRGSDNLFTGPVRDFVSSNNNELTGSYLQIEPGYPRRPGDRAVLSSPLFQATSTNDPMCMRLAVHMFGSGIGTLAIKIRFTDDAIGPNSANNSAASSNNNNPQSANSQASSSQSSSAGGGGSSSSGQDAAGANDLVIWEMSGDSGNIWHRAQTSVSSSKSAFYVLIEGVIGENQLSNIAIDEISFSQGACPSSPPVASKNYGDCTFEQSGCYWRNPSADIHLDDLDWIRMAEEQTIHGPNQDHTTKKRSGHYLKLENTLREPKSGMRAFLLSPIFQPRNSVQCLSFYYYMFMRSISSSGPNLGTIRVYLASNNELTPIWRLTNPISSPIWKHARVSLSSTMLDGQPVAPAKLFQIAFEGIWGDAAGGAIALDDVTVFEGACELMPMDAKAVAGECTFDVDFCSWVNKTVATNSNAPDANPAADSPNSSPFIQYINGANPIPNLGNQKQQHPQQQQNLQSQQNQLPGWQLATVNSRPINLQDHTYKAPIGYAYVDVLEHSMGPNSARVPFVLQSNEVFVQQGQQVAQCLSFWFAAFGRHESNQLQVYLTQASVAPPQPGEDNQSGRNLQQSSPAQAGSSQNQPSGAASGSPSGSGDPNSPNSGDPSQSAWKDYDGRLIWSVALKNMTEMSRRRWDYAQVSIKADSNYIVRFIAVSSDGGFALDDISYYEGACETRPAIARVLVDPDSDQSSSGSGSPGSGSNPTGSASGGSSASGGNKPSR